MIYKTIAPIVTTLLHWGGRLIRVLRIDAVARFFGLIRPDRGLQKKKKDQGVSPNIRRTSQSDQPMSVPQVGVWRLLLEIAVVAAALLLWFTTGILLGWVLSLAEVVALVRVIP